MVESTHTHTYTHTYVHTNTHTHTHTHAHTRTPAAGKPLRSWNKDYQMFTQVAMCKLLTDSTAWRVVRWTSKWQGRRIVWTFDPHTHTHRFTHARTHTHSQTHTHAHTIDCDSQCLCMCVVVVYMSYYMHNVWMCWWVYCLYVFGIYYTSISLLWYSFLFERYQTGIPVPHAVAAVITDLFNTPAWFQLRRWISKTIILILTCMFYVFPVYFDGKFGGGALANWYGKLAPVVDRCFEMFSYDWIFAFSLPSVAESNPSPPLNNLQPRWTVKGSAFLDNTVINSSITHFRRQILM